MDLKVTDLKTKMESGDRFVLIDVREPHEHEEFNIGGNLIPLGNFPAVIAQLEDHKGDEIVVYCRSGRRSGAVQLMLQQAGFEKVYNLEGGMLAWIDAYGQ